MASKRFDSGLYIQYHMVTERKSFSREELAYKLEVTPRSVTRYVSDVNSFFCNNFIPLRIVYDRSEKKYIAKVMLPL